MARSRTSTLPVQRPIALAAAFIVALAAVLSQTLNRGPTGGTTDPGPAAGESITAYFSPAGGCTDAIVRQIRNAKTSIHVQAYSFTSSPIAEALLEAQKRGVKVSVILDKSQRSERYSSLKFFQNQSVPVHIDARHAIAHNKVMLIDGQTLITGSFNFTKSAERDNAENLLIIAGRPKLYAAYEQNFQRHLAHADPPG